LGDDAGVLYPLLRPLLYRLDPERAHGMAISALGFAGALAPIRAALRSACAPGRDRPVEAFGLTFPNPVGLAAGYDKDALGWRGLACLGFGHLEIGTVTLRPQPGNPRPRMFRLVEERSLINRLGFPSRGADFVAGRLDAARPRGLIVGVNIGKQKETPLEDAADDYEQLMERFASRADYLVVNISSPNTPGLRKLQQRDWLDPLLRRLMAKKRELDGRADRPCPLLVKLSPDLADDELEQAVGAITVAGLDGVVATNTTISRENVRSWQATETGGLSGAALTEASTAVVRKIRKMSGERLTIVACGGVMGPSDAQAKLDAGASLVQLYTGLIYEGPTLVRRIVDGLRRQV
jgi:dihydroorotate dehydrogenase